MNKRGQMYILAAVLLCIAIYGVMKVTNRLEMPAETNFDFYVENFKGERSYVVDYGLLMDDERVMTGGGLLDIFTKFGSGTGIIYAEYKGGQWNIVNYLGQDIYMIDQDTNEKEVLAKEEQERKNMEELNSRADQVMNGLEQMGLRATALEDEELVELFYNLYNPESARRELAKSTDNK